jgi:hypothetical protein
VDSTGYSHRVVAGVQISRTTPKLQTNSEETNRIPVRHVKIEGGSAKARSRCNRATDAAANRLNRLGPPNPRFTQQ